MARVGLGHQQQDFLQEMEGPVAAGDQLIAVLPVGMVDSAAAVVIAIIQTQLTMLGTVGSVEAAGLPALLELAVLVV